MKVGWISALLVIVWAGGSSVKVSLAQQGPDWILYNGKVVTVDNHTVNSNLGTIAEAVAIQDGKILAVGKTADVRRLAGANTKSYDLKGRTLTPGFVDTHDQPQDWDPLNPYILKKVVSNDVVVERFFWDDPPEQQLQKFPQVLDEAVHKAKPGQWIRISLLFGKEYRWRNQITSFLGRQITKEMLDRAAPNNPVLVRTGFIGMLINQKAIEEVKKAYGDQWDMFLNKPLQAYGGGPSAETSGLCMMCYRDVEQDVIYPFQVQREMYRLGLSWLGGYGVTVNASSMYTAGALRAYRSLDHAGQMPIRFSWSWFWPERNDFFFDPYFLQAIVAQEGRGSDYFWFSGMTSHHGLNCSKLPGTSPQVKQVEFKCGFSDPVISRALYEYIKAGGRLTGDHQIGDGEIDLVLDIIEKASQDAGMTLEDIRAKRHIVEHMAMFPRPDQIPRLKNLGVMTSGWDFHIWEGSGEQIRKDYGEAGAMQVVPRKSLYNAGIMNSVEIARPLGYTNFTYFQVLYSGITRKDMDGNLIAPQEAVDRQAMLKSATLWGAYAVKKEQVLGSIEPGKFADLLVMDRDYLTVPVDDIPKLHVLLTMVGGKIIHLVPSLAREWGLQPTGAQVELGAPASRW